MILSSSICLLPAQVSPLVSRWAMSYSVPLDCIFVSVSRSCQNQLILFPVYPWVCHFLIRGPPKKENTTTINTKQVLSCGLSLNTAKQRGTLTKTTHSLWACPAQESVRQADASGRYEPLPVRVPVEPMKSWHDAEELERVEVQESVGTTCSVKHRCALDG